MSIKLGMTRKRWYTKKEPVSHSNLVDAGQQGSHNSYLCSELRMEDFFTEIGFSKEERSLKTEFFNERSEVRKSLQTGSEIFVMI